MCRIASTAVTDSVTAIALEKTKPFGLYFMSVASILLFAVLVIKFISDECLQLLLSLLLLTTAVYASLVVTVHWRDRIMELCSECSRQ